MISRFGKLLFVPLLACNLLAVTADWARADVLSEKLAPFSKKYCVSCHNQKTAKGELDLTRYAGDADVTKDFRRWLHVIEFVRKGEMPPDDRPQPTLAERSAYVANIQAILLVEAKKHAGDPGVVLPRRLSNTEYDQSIRDLTGVPILATKEFPVDPAGGEGFDNTGEALGMTPNLLNKYLGAAQFVADHLVLKPDGIVFAPFPVKSYNERKKLTEQAIIDFYRDHDVRISDYLEAAWRYRHRPEKDRSVNVDDWAKRSKLSGPYLSLVNKTLDDAATGDGFLKTLGELWQGVPAPTKSGNVPEELRAVERFILLVQTRLSAKEPNLINSNAGNWPIAHLALRAKVAANRDNFAPASFKSKTLAKFNRLPQKPSANESATTLFLRIDPAFGAQPGTVIVHKPVISKGDNLPRNAKERESQGVVTLRSLLEKESPEVARKLGFGKHPDGSTLDADSFAVKAPATVEIPLSATLVNQVRGKRMLAEVELDAKSSAGSALLVQTSFGKLPEFSFGSAELLVRPGSDIAKKWKPAAERFFAAFPDRFFYVDRDRGLAAGFHLVEGFFRDDQPLRNKVLTDTERAELDRLWRELDFVTESVETLLRGFVWFERAERHVLHDKRFDFLRSEDPDLVKDELLTKFERVYLEKLGVKLVEGKIEPIKTNEQFDLIHGFFEQVRTGLKTHNDSLKKAEAPALEQLQRVAERAYCRPLRPDESKSLRTLYDRLRKQGQDVEDSLRGTFIAVLMSPHFFYRIPSAPAGGGVHVLANDALARRLSYFLWGSLPDAELLKLSRDGKLQDEAVLRSQVRRMMKDPKVESFAREFFGQWLRYRDYLSKDTIPAGVFKDYDADLRQAMFEEPTRLITHLMQTDRSIDELLHSDATFVNAPLARFYGGKIESQYRELAGQRTGTAKVDPKADWHRVEGLRSQGRGGLFGLPVVLAKNSAGQRTSPVKRGFWVVHRLLGQHFPPPPADVPELPKSEKESAKTIREMLAIHVTNRQCAMCHVHFDGLGLTMEGFDAIGRARTRDLAGRKIDSVGPLPGGKSAEGVAGLIEYVEKQRKKEFERNLCRKLLGYALGRSVQLSDEPLLDEMERTLQTDRRFSALFEAVVLSPQFRKQRGKDYVAGGR